MKKNFLTFCMLAGVSLFSVSCMHMHKKACCGGDSCKMEKSEKGCPDCKNTEASKDGSKGCKDCKE